MKKNSQIAIIGAGAPSCVLALHLEKKKYDITIFEKSKNIGGAWGVDKSGSKYSNIIYPLSKNEHKIFRKAYVYLKGVGIEFKKNIEKSLFSKKIVKASSCNFSNFYKIVEKKIKIKKNCNVMSVTEKEERIIINNKFYFDHVIFPTYVDINKFEINKKNLKKNIHLPYEKINKSLHVRALVSNLYKNNLIYNKLTIGPMDRCQVIKKNKSTFQINGRILLDWKKKSKEEIKKKIIQTNIFQKLLKINFFIYESCIRSSENIKILKRRLGKSKRIHYLETFTLLEFIEKNIFKKKLLKLLK